MTTVAACFEALGQYAESVKLREETLALQKAKLGPDNSETLLNMAHLADNLIHLNRGTEAIPMIDECLTRGTGKDVDPSLIPSVLDLRLRYFAKARDAGACRKTADMWEEMKRLDAGALYNAACFRAIAASTFLATDKSHKGAQEAATEAGRPWSGSNKPSRPAIRF